MLNRLSTIKSPTLLCLVLAMGCIGDKTVDSGVVCEDPVAVASGSATITLGGTVSLDASGSNVCSTYSESATYTWAFEQVPAGSAVDESSLSDNKTNSASASSFIPDMTGDYVLTLMITDSLADSVLDYFVVSVVSGDQPPVADCGDNLSGAVNESLTLDGTGSYDPEGASIEYYWTLSDVPDCSSLDSDDIYNSAGPSPSVVPDCDGIFTVALVVSDSVQYSDPDICYLDIASGNRAPVADAGDGNDYTNCADNPLPLNAWGSYDLDGDDLVYLWSVVSVPEGSTADDTSFTDSSSAEPRFYWDVAGDYMLQLQVHDGEFWSAPDIVSFSIGDSDSNTSPYANAGEDVEVNTDADCETASYVWTCGDCPAETFDLDGSGSYDDDGDDLSFTWSESTGTVSFSNTWGPITEATIEEQVATYGVDSTMTLDINLEVADCQATDNDTITVSYTCTGEAP
jgi:hypothetical protein